MTMDRPVDETEALKPLSGLDVRFPPDTRRATTPLSNHDTGPDEQGRCRDTPCRHGRARRRANHGDALGFRLRRNSRRRPDLVTRRPGPWPVARKHGVTWHRGHVSTSGAAPAT